MAPAPIAYGLTEEEAHQRFLAFGPNETPAGDVRGLGAIVLETMREPMLLLIGAAILYLGMGDLGEG